MYILSNVRVLGTVHYVHLVEGTSIGYCYCMLCTFSRRYVYWVLYVMYILSKVRYGLMLTNGIADYVEVHEGKVTVCRDAAKGKCTRPMCKYYHVPMLGGGASSVASLTRVLTSQSTAALDSSTNQHLAVAAQFVPVVSAV